MAAPSDPPADVSLDSGRDAAPVPARSDQLALLHRILDERLLQAHFQPIIDLATGAVAGYEGLIRGPADSPLHMPVDLFRAAVKHGLVLRLERLCRLTVVQAFAGLGLPQQLFLNVRPQCLALPGLGTSATCELLQRLAIAPERIVIELTEHLPMFDFSSVRTALTGYRSLGFQVAIDDLGEGFASFRMWSELRPEFVKADMHFVQGIDRDPLKLQFLRSIQQMARASGSAIIAEGIETAAEFAVVRDLGIPYGQGYYIARPAARPPLAAPEHVLALLRERRAAARIPAPAANVAELLIPVTPVTAATPCSEALARFEQDQALHALPVVDAGRPIGLIERRAFLSRWAHPPRGQRPEHRPCSEAMDAAPLLVEEDVELRVLARHLAHEQRHLVQGFVVTRQGRYAGLGSGQDVMREIARLLAQMEAAGPD